ncbi:MAG: hypothetical protein ABL862_02410 [Candidatus Nitrotoga sp.]
MNSIVTDWRGQIVACLIGTTAMLLRKVITDLLRKTVVKTVPPSRFDGIPVVVLGCP